MSSDQNEDDWESAEKRLKDLSIKNKSSAPPKLLLRPPMNVSQSTSANNTQPHSRTRTPTPASTDPSAELDSALISAVSDPRERMAVFQIENNILNFMNSNDTTMDIPPGHNSFRRLLTYRIGQRFGLSHATSDQLLGEGGGDRSGNVSIQLFKTPASAIPSVLLIDMNIATPHGESGGDQTTGSDSPFDSSQHSSTNNSSSGAGPRKMSVMKRKPSKTTNDTASARSAGSAAKQQQSAEDKEKAYLQARARIFGETEPSTPGGSCSSPAKTPEGCEPVEGPSLSGATTPKSDIAVHSINGSITTLSSPDHSNCSSGKISKNSSSNSLSTAGIAVEQQQPAGSKKPIKNPAAKAKAASMPHTGKAPSLNDRNTSTSESVGRPQQGQAGGRAVVNAGAWKGNKSQVRNLELEKADPDFMRQGPNRQHNGGGNNNIGVQQQHQQQSSLPVQQQRPMLPDQQLANPASGTDPSTAIQLQQQQQMDMQMQQYMQMQQQFQQQQFHMQMYQQQQQGAPYYPYPPIPQQQMPPYPNIAHNPYYSYGGAALSYPQQTQQQPGYPGQQGGNSSVPAEGFNRNDFPPLR